MYVCARTCAHTCVCPHVCVPTRVCGLNSSHNWECHLTFIKQMVEMYINPLAPNDHYTGWYFATPECRMTSTLVTSSRVENQVFSEAKGRSIAFKISSIQCLVFCCCYLTRMRDFKKVRKNCAVGNAILQRLPVESKPSKAQFSYPLA